MSCARCKRVTETRKRQFSDQALSALLVWYELDKSMVDAPLCSDCYEELRETLIDRASELEEAARQPVPEPLPALDLVAGQTLGRHEPSFGAPLSPMGLSSESVARDNEVKKGNVRSITDVDRAGARAGSSPAIYGPSAQEKKQAAAEAAVDAACRVRVFWKDYQ